MFDVEGVKKLASETPTTKVVFDALAKRERARGITNLNWFKYAQLSGGSGISTDEFIEVFKKLESLGIGEFIRSRKTKNGSVTPPRFAWKYNLKDVAKAAFGELKGANEVKDAPKKASGKGLKHDKPKANEVITTPYGFSVTFSLPKNVKSEDLGALLSLIQDMGK